jgi:Mlc titration factor MtfA (ptsG expression regulator)
MSASAGLALLAATAAVLALLAWAAYGRTHRRPTRSSDPPHEDLTAFLQSLRLYRRLPPELQRQLEPRVREFLRTVEFTGCAGLEVTQEMRVVIAGQACLLGLGLPERSMQALYGVSLYPDEFLVEESDEDPDSGVVTEGTRALSGQTLETDRIVLSWQDVREAQQRDDGYNVVIHEFTHFLDHAAGPWRSAGHSALQAEYELLCAAVERGEPTLIDPYGAEDPTEFLAVAAEIFFELPLEMREQHPALYGTLRGLFALDPAAWPGRD